MKHALAVCLVAMMFALIFWHPAGSILSNRTPAAAADAPAGAPPPALPSQSYLEKEPLTPKHLAAPASIAPTAPTGNPLTVAGNKSAYRYSGPYTHANLTLYLVHGADAIDAAFLTLGEAMAQNKVIVHETGNVGELAIENVSSTEEIFVQSGDIVKGGQQDRVMATDFIVPRKSGKMPIASFCAEHGRWSQRGGEQSGTFGSSTEQAPGKSFKMAAKKEANQSAVWNEVSENQKKLSEKLSHEVRSLQSASSYELTLENSAVRETAEDYTKALSPSIDGKNDAVGFVFAINGKTNNADIYATHALFVKLWPKLLKSAAIEAIAEQQKNIKFEPVSNEDVMQLVEEPEKARPTSKTVNSRVRIETKETDANILWETNDSERGDKPVHRSFIRK